MRTSIAGRTPLLNAHVCDPLHCPEIQQIIRDPWLASIAKAYLGYMPNRVQPSIIWSIASKHPIADTASQLTYDASEYHYDTNAYNCVQAMFFLTNVDRDSGAHQVIVGSHKNKPLAMKLQSSTRIGDQRLRDYFGAQAETILEGDRGWGFMEDPICFHRVIHPTRSNRLAVIVIYS